MEHWRECLLFSLVIVASPFFGPVTAQDPHPCDGIKGSYNSWKNKAEKRGVAIVGGGMAGLSAAKKFLKWGFSDFILLEAQNYLGGRVKTYRQGNILTEDGAEWVHGGRKNFLWRMAKTKITPGLAPQNKDRYAVRYLTPEGRSVSYKGWKAARKVFNKCEVDKNLQPYLDTGYGKCYLALFDRIYKAEGAPPKQKAAWMDYLHAWVKKDAGFDNWLHQSARDAKYFTDFGLDQWGQWKEGYDALPKYYKQSIPDNNIKMESPVCKIFWNTTEDGAIVVTSKGEAYKVYHVLVTASVGHVKERQNKLFSPNLPKWYKDYLKGIKLGIADKVQLGFGTKWWPGNRTSISTVFMKKNLPKEKAWLYGIMEFVTIHQMPNMIQAFVSGKHARMMESLPEDTVKDHLVEHLKSLFPRKYIPDPTFFRRSLWLANEWMLGSYNSYVTVKGDQNGLRNRTVFAGPIYDQKETAVIFFAGEHVSRTRYGTVDGAMKSGDVAAEEIMYWNGWATKGNSAALEKEEQEDDDEEEEEEGDEVRVLKDEEADEEDWDEGEDDAEEDEGEGEAEIEEEEEE